MIPERRLAIYCHRQSWFIIFTLYIFFCRREKVKKKKSSGNIFCTVRKWAVLRLRFNSAWSGSSSHRWWTNVLLKERCTRLGSCTAQQWASLAADGLKSSHRQTWLLPSICDAMQLEKWNTCPIYCIFHFVFVVEHLPNHFTDWSVLIWGSFDMALLLVNVSVSLFQHHHP